jgi:hypothetical protein
LSKFDLGRRFSAPWCLSAPSVAAFTTDRPGSSATCGIRRLSRQPVAAHGCSIGAKRNIVDAVICDGARCLEINMESAGWRTPVHSQRFPTRGDFKMVGEVEVR